MPVSDETRFKREQKIIEAAKDLFIERGYQNVSMDRVAEAANIVKATIYKYFPSKDELYFAVCCVVYNQRWQLVKPAEDGKTGFEMLEEFIDKFINHAYDTPNMFYFVTNSNQELFEVIHLRDDIDQSIYKRYIPLVQDAFAAYNNIFKKGYEDGSIKRFEDFSIEMYFLYSLRGYLLERVIAIIKFYKKNSESANSHDSFMQMIEKEVNYLRQDLLNKVKNNQGD